MSEPHFLCALDVVDTLVLNSRDAKFQIWGWIIAANANVKIDEVFVDCDGKGRYRTSFPQPRPDVASHYPDLENAASSGFVTPGIPLQFRADESVDVTVIAQCNGVEYPVLTKQVRLVWFDPDNELFSLGKVGPFSFPDELDESRLTAYAECKPVFLISANPLTRSARSAVKARIPHLADGDIFHDLLIGLTECHDVYVEYRRNYFTHFHDQIDGFAIGKFDAYAVLNSIIATVHKRVMSEAVGQRPVYVLTGKRHLVLLPLIRRIYPLAKYVHLRPGALARWADWLVRSRDAPSKRGVAGTAKYNPYQDAFAGRSFDQLLHILTKARKHDIGEIHWSSAVSSRRLAERLLSRLKIDLPDPKLAGRNDNAVATQPATSSSPVPGYLQVIPESSDASPVFVLGGGRSGTSAVVGAMNAAGIEGFSEGHLFPMLDEMARRLWGRYLRAPAPPPGLGGVRVRILEAVLTTAFASVYGGYGRRTWIDKTPDHPMIDCVPFLRALFPRAKFLMMIRHPIAFVESRRRKFGESLLSAANEWVRCIDSWKSAKSGLTAFQYREVDLDKLNDSSLLQEDLSSFLDLDDEQRKSFTDYLASERPEFTRVSPGLLKALEGLDGERGYNLRSIFYAMLSRLGEYADGVGWDGETAQQIFATLGTLPEEFGYAIHRPDDHLESLLLGWAREFEELRHTAEYQQKNAAHWAEEARNWKTAASEKDTNAAYWAEQVESWRAAASQKDTSAAYWAEQAKNWKTAAEHQEKNAAYWAEEARPGKLDELRHTAESHEKNAAYWAEEARNWKTAAEQKDINAAYWAEQAQNWKTAADQKDINAAYWAEQANNWKITAEAREKDAAYWAEEAKKREIAAGSRKRS